MAVKHEMIIEIAPDGSLKIKTHGIKGAECEDELKPIENALGKVKERTRTREYYEKSSVSGKQKIGSKAE